MTAEVLSILALGTALLSMLATVGRWRSQTAGLRGVHLRTSALESLHEHRMHRLEHRRQRLEGRLRGLEEMLSSMERRLAEQQAYCLPGAPTAAMAWAGGEPLATLPTPIVALADRPTEAALATRSRTPAERPVPAVRAPEAPAEQSTVDSGPVRVGQTVLRRFLIQREIGRGGMGTVYLAKDLQLGELVALKVLSGPLGSGSRAATDRFRREALAARKITHPNVIRIYDLCEEGGQLFLSMEYAPGQTLAELLAKRRKPMPVAEAMAVLDQVCEGLSAAHRAGIVHRDLKPENVLVDSASGERRIKLIDFGLARASFLRCLTESGLILGTPEYMAPEQVRGASSDVRSDVYSLGCMAYHMLTGDPPFLAETPIGVAFRHCNDTPRRPRELRPDLPRHVEDAILRALAKDPRERFGSVAEMKQALLAPPQAMLRAA